MTLRCPDCGWSYDADDMASSRPYSEPLELVPYHYESPESPIPCDGTNRQPVRTDAE